MSAAISLHYSDKELEQILRHGESDIVERKETFQGEAPTSVREAVCAFANDLPNHRRAGCVFIGVRDDGVPAGLAITDELLRKLADIKTDGSIIPPPTMTVEKRTVLGSDVAVICVAPSDTPPVTYKGRIWIRVGPRRALASAQDERILNEKRRYRDTPFDVRPIYGASLADLDEQRFVAEYLPAAVAPDVLERNDRTTVQRLAAAKMIVQADEPVPTVLGMLVMGKTTLSYLPGAYVQFLRIEGRALGDPIIDEERIDGDVLAMVMQLESKLVAHNRVAVDLTTGMRERRTPLYPLPALQQIVRNAILHRSYEHTNSPVRVTWYDDRIEFLNPGGPYGTVTPENFGSPGVTDYRNPNLAEAMRVLGLVQRFGVGIATARRELANNGNPPPEFAVKADHVLVTIRPAQ